MFNVSLSETQFTSSFSMYIASKVAQDVRSLVREKLNEIIKEELDAIVYKATLDVMSDLYADQTNIKVNIIVEDKR
jgi:hypothetical protein